MNNISQLPPWLLPPWLPEPEFYPSDGPAYQTQHVPYCVQLFGCKTHSTGKPHEGRPRDCQPCMQTWEAWENYWTNIHRI